MPGRAQRRLAPVLGGLVHTATVTIHDAASATTPPPPPALASTVAALLADLAARKAAAAAAEDFGTAAQCKQAIAVLAPRPAVRHRPHRARMPCTSVPLAPILEFQPLVF